MSFTRYDRRTGAIISIDSHVDTASLPAHIKVLNGAFDPARYWVRRGKAVLLAEMPVTAEGRTLRGLPKGATVHFQGARVKVSSFWTAPGAGADNVLVECRGYRSLWVGLVGRDAARAAAYPPLGDQLDAIAKGFGALADAGLPLPPATRAWLDVIAAVKAAHPKAEE